MDFVSSWVDPLKGISPALFVGATGNVEDKRLEVDAGLFLEGIRGRGKCQLVFIRNGCP